VLKGDRNFYYDLFERNVEMRPLNIEIEIEEFKICRIYEKRLLGIFGTLIDLFIFSQPFIIIDSKGIIFLVRKGYEKMNKYLICKIFNL
jgi:hypothetical protein